MNISSISAKDSIARRNAFIEYANHFLNFKAKNDGDDTPVSKPDVEPVNKLGKNMGIETLTIFPKQVIDGKTIITA